MKIVCPHCYKSIDFIILPPKENLSVLKRSQKSSVVYFIADEISENTFGCWRGPAPYLREMLNVIGHNDNSFIIKGTEEHQKKIYRWNSKTQKWVGL